jgi:hypothetical protein
MNKLLFLFLVFTLLSCVTTRPYLRKKPRDYFHKLETCMMSFSKQGYDSTGIINICKSIYERRP